MKAGKLWGSFLTILCVMATDFIIHQVFLKGTYMATASLWRPEAEMANTWPTMLLGQALVGWFIFWIFSIGYKGQGWKEAWRFALYFGFFEAGKNLIMFSVAPYTWQLVCAWAFWGFVQMWAVGLVATWSIKKWHLETA